MKTLVAVVLLCALKICQLLTWPTEPASKTESRIRTGSEPKKDMQNYREKKKHLNIFGRDLVAASVESEGGDVEDLPQRYQNSWTTEVSYFMTEVTQH